MTYKIPAGIKLRRKLSAGKKIDRISWSPHGTQLAAELDIGKIKIWDVDNEVADSAKDALPDQIHEWTPWNTECKVDEALFLLDSPFISCEVNSNSDFSGILGRVSVKAINEYEFNYKYIPDLKRFYNFVRHHGKSMIINYAYSSNSSIFASNLFDSNTIDLFETQIKTNLIKRHNLSPIYEREAEEVYIGKYFRTLEGHTDAIVSISFSFDSKFLASMSLDNTIRLWSCDKWETVAIIRELSSGKFRSLIAFNPKFPMLAAVVDGGKVINIWDLDFDELSRIPSAIKTIHYSSAKIVFVGESNAGKSCLSLRLSEDRYEELETTHGTRFWTLLPEQLDPVAVTPPGKKRDVVIWDMGGQNEYRLVHQIFLHDVTLALILFDPTRGQNAFKEVEEWNKRLDKQLSGNKATKILVGTKLDDESTIIDEVELERLIKSCDFEGYYPISSRTGRGISELRAAISKNINWDASSESSRPEFFQIIRDEVENLKGRGKAVISFPDLSKSIRKKYPLKFEIEALDTVLRHLSLQGVVSDTETAIGERMIILHIGEIERYAGSLIIAARNNPRGVPAIEEQILVSPRMSFPGIKEEDRLPRLEERVILECVVQLLIEHGICLQHEGLLIFPTLFKPTVTDRVGSVSHSISLYYDFSGAIDNIYSSLVAWLAISERFGRSRFWEDRAEFEIAGKGACGLRKIDRGSGFAHLDVYFEDRTPQEMRDLFISFVESHLRQYGIEIQERIEITCKCSYHFSEESIRRRISNGNTDIGCPECDVRTTISEGAIKAREIDPDLERKTWALKTEIREKKDKIIEEVKVTFKKTDASQTSLESLWLLHLSDLHFDFKTDPMSQFQPIATDLNNLKESLGFEKLDYLVVSGDLTNHGKPEEFENARQFISSLIMRFGLTAERCIIVPGNHDLDWDEDVYNWINRRLIDTEKLANGRWIRQGDGYLIRNEERYPSRFRSFSENFYHPLVQKEYPLEFKDQCISIPFFDDGIQFIALNSCWEIDEYFPKRSSINQGTLARGLENADRMIRSFSSNKSVLKIAVWHHPVTGNDKIKDDAFLEQLRENGIRVCLHGHVHEDETEIINYLHPKRVYVSGTGSFGAPVCERPESTPRLYSLLEISRDHRVIRIHTRCRQRKGGAWDGWAVWPSESANEKRTYYEIRF
ncbi:hypothetical protein Mhar_2360 [Methanothrix harundinacea 6Ac]|uniref:Calcineurin-like phosphoesterase domain-containing protein n=2 Tax=Methanothrix harundinacea TaxID=301375 RepID=G7WRG9_METH6|nr:hypothetical protein Mhar_2360 [Methanothrix harundinacea 6Ac]